MALLVCTAGDVSLLIPPAPSRVESGPLFSLLPPQPTLVPLPAVPLCSVTGCSVVFRGNQCCSVGCLSWCPGACPRLRCAPPLRSLLCCALLVPSCWCSTRLVQSTEEGAPGALLCKAVRNEQTVRGAPPLTLPLSPSHAPLLFSPCGRRPSRRRPSPSPTRT